MDKVHSTLDVYIAAWIFLTTGTYPTLKNHKGKVSFHFPLTDEVIQSIGNYNSGKKIEALKFALTIKNLKSQIFSLKNQSDVGQ